MKYIQIPGVVPGPWDHVTLVPGPSENLTNGPWSLGPFGQWSLVPGTIWPMLPGPGTPIQSLNYIHKNLSNYLKIQSSTKENKSNFAYCIEPCSTIREQNRKLQVSDQYSIFNYSISYAWDIILTSVSYTHLTLPPKA